MDVHQILFGCFQNILGFEKVDFKQHLLGVSNVVISKFFCILIHLELSILLS
jgi:hypothetical protein